MSCRTAEHGNAEGGRGFELGVIAGGFIGGASAYGGVRRVAGALIMGVTNNGMSILGIGIDYRQVRAWVLFGAVCLDVYNRRR